MEQIIKQVIDKILSFNYEELEKWVKSRLHGDDKYFPIYEGYETNLGGFLLDTYMHIKNEEFRESFLCILESLTIELEYFSIEQIEEESNYIYELLWLCGHIRQFKNNDSLYRLACSRRLKNVYAFDLELHQLLLTAMGSTIEVCEPEFWIEQMKDDSNKYYANTAFYVLLAGADPGILFDHIGIFIDRFMDDQTMKIDLGIRSIIGKYGRAETFRRFESIEKKLSDEQKKAINEALYESGYDEIFKRKMITHPFLYDEIASLPIQGLSIWIRDRLAGYDLYFPITAGNEQKKFELIAEAYESICTRNFRDNFHEIMNNLIKGLKNISLNIKEIAFKKEYIYELISLFGRIPDFKYKSDLYCFAREGNFKGINAFDREETDLHRVILKTLASNRGTGDYNFWNEQIKQDEEKWYVIIAFSALVSRGYRLDITLNPVTFGIFLNRIKDDENGLVEFNSCIKALINEYGKERVLQQLNNIEENLTGEQKAAVKIVLENFGL